MKILVVDDNPTNRLLLKYMVKNEGHYVVEAENGEEAIELATKQDFDIIFMDMMMPLVDGYEATRRIRETDDAVKIYVVSAYQEKEFPPQWKGVRYDGILAKPIELEQIKNIISPETE